MNDRAISLTIDPTGMRERDADFTKLSAEITTLNTSGNPFISLAFLLSHPELSDLDEFLNPAQDQLVIHDYQVFKYAQNASIDKQDRAECAIQSKGATTELALDLAGTGSLKTALRSIPKVDLAKAKPLQLRADSLANAISHDNLICTQSHVSTYVSISGDTNAIHTDPARAQSLGLPDTIVPGLLLVGLIQPVFEKRADTKKLQSLRARFTAPMITGTPFAISILERSPTSLRAFVHSAAGAHVVADFTLGAD